MKSASVALLQAPLCVCVCVDRGEGPDGVSDKWLSGDSEVRPSADKDSSIVSVKSEMEEFEFLFIVKRTKFEKVRDELRAKTSGDFFGGG